MEKFRTCFFSPFSSFNDEKNCYKYYNKRTTTRDNGNVHSHDKKKVNWILQLLRYSYWMNSFFIILSCVSVWAPLFALMVLFNLLSSYHEIEHYELWFAYCNTCNNFFIIKVWKWTEETRPKCRLKQKTWICRISCYYLYFEHKLWLCDSL